MIQGLPCAQEFLSRSLPNNPHPYRCQNVSVFAGGCRRRHRDASPAIQAAGSRISRFSVTFHPPRRNGCNLPSRRIPSMSVGVRNPLNARNLSVSVFRGLNPVGISGGSQLSCLCFINFDTGFVHGPRAGLLNRRYCAFLPRERFQAPARDI